MNLWKPFREKLIFNVLLRAKPTWDDARFLTSFQGLKIIGVPTAASVLKQLAASRVHVEEESILDGLAVPRIVLQGAQLVEDEELGQCSI